MKILIQTRLFVGAAALILSSILACTTASKSTDSSATPASAAVEKNRIRILTFNVENLFDTKDNPQKNDESFLPLEAKSSDLMRSRCHSQNESFRVQECLYKDWSEKVLDRKMRRLADVVAQVNGGYGPDILILQEVENREVLEQWREKYLKKMNYQTILILDGPDERGINTAVISRLPAAGEPKLHLIDFTTNPNIAKDDIRPTRGILETHLQLPDDEKLYVFSIHFPSQGASTEHRKSALESLKKVVASLPAESQVVVGGDFNITSTEDWKHKYYRDLMAPDFAVSHLVGCKGCTGTTYYKDDETWSFFDVLLFSKNMTAPEARWKLDTESIQIVNSSKFQTNRWGTPAKFSSGKGADGVSDHWPVYAELRSVGAK